MPGVCLRMLEGDARVMTEDEVVLNTTLNPTESLLCGTARCRYVDIDLAIGTRMPDG
jgi:hypothetical protein